MFMGLFNNKNKILMEELSNNVNSLTAQLEETKRQFEVYRDQQESICDQINLGFSYDKSSIKTYRTLSLAPVFAAIDKISNAVASMPWLVKPFDDNDEVPLDFYVNRIFENNVMTRFLFVKCLIRDVLVHGNGYAYIKRDKDGTPISLIYLPWGKCTPNEAQFLNTGRLTYSLNDVNLFDGRGQSSRTVEAIDIIHVLDHTENGIVGKGVLEFAAQSIEMAKYTERAAENYYSRDLKQTGILSTDAPRLDKKQRKEIRDAYMTGINSESGIAVLEGGMKFEAITANAKEASLMDARLNNLRDIGMFFLMLPPQLGDLSHLSYNSLEQAAADFVMNCLPARVMILQEELNRKLILPRHRYKFYIDIDEDAIIKSDKVSQAQVLTSYSTNGIMRVNEVRKKIGLPPVEGGDILMVPYTDISQNIISDKNDKSDEDKNEKNIDSSNEED